MLRLCLIFLLILPGFAVSGQHSPYMLLHKSGTQKQVRFYEGDQIRFRMRGEDHYRKALIIGFRQDTVRFHYFEVALRDLEFIDIRRMGFQNFHFESGGNKVIFAGALFLLGDFVNQELIQDNGAGVGGETLAITGAIIGAGVILRFFEKKKFRPGGRYVIDIIDFRQR